MAANGKKPKITTGLQVGLTTESAQLVALASDALQIAPGTWGRIAINEKLVRDGIPQMAQLMSQANASQK